MYVCATAWEWKSENNSRSWFSSLKPSGSWETKLGHQAWQQVSLSVEPSPLAISFEIQQEQWLM